MPKRKRVPIDLISIDVAKSRAEAGDDDVFPPTPKRRGLGEPDVTIVVGKQSFLHHSFLLCYASEYFDTMLSSGMQESQNKRIEFPDKDPEEWKLVYSFLEPRALSTAVGVRITKDNAKALLPWFHEFGMTAMLKESDERLWSSLLLFKKSYAPACHRTLNDRRNALMEIVGWTETADTYGLPRTHTAMMKELKVAVKNYPELVTKPLLERMVGFFKEEELWEYLKARLPEDVTSNHDDDTLKENPLFLDMLSQGFRIANLENIEERRSSWGSSWPLEGEPEVEAAAADSDEEVRPARRAWGQRARNADIRRMARQRQLLMRRRLRQQRAPAAAIDNVEIAGGGGNYGAGQRVFDLVENFEHNPPFGNALRAHAARPGALAPNIGGGGGDGA